MTLLPRLSLDYYTTVMQITVKKDIGPGLGVQGTAAGGGPGGPLGWGDGPFGRPGGGR